MAQRFAMAQPDNISYEPMLAYDRPDMLRRMGNNIPNPTVAPSILGRLHLSMNEFANGWAARSFGSFMSDMFDRYIKGRHDAAFEIKHDIGSDYSEVLLLDGRGMPLRSRDSAPVEPVQKGRSLL